MSRMQDIAKHAGVSTATISHVLNGTRWVSEEVKARVWAAIEELDYQPNRLARSLRRGETQTLGLIIPSTNEPIFAEMARSIEDTAYEHGYSVIVCNSDNQLEKESSYTRVLVEKQVDGLFFITVTMQADHSEIRRLLERSRTPVVAVDREVPDLGADVVLGYRQQGGWLVTRHLLDLGHRRIGCATTTSSIGPFVEILAGYRQALSERGLSLNAELIAKTPPSDDSFTRGYQGARHLLASRDRPTAIVACNDMMALGVLRAAREAGLRVPEDLSVTGCDDIAIASQLPVALTTLSLSRAEVAAAALQMLLERMRSPGLPPRREVLDLSLVVRESTAKPWQGG